MVIVWPASLICGRLAQRYSTISSDDEREELVEYLAWYRARQRSRGHGRELRRHYGNTLYRILYLRSDNLFVLLHIFEKRTGAIPDAGKQVARERWADFQRRMDETPRHHRAPQAMTRLNL